MVEMTLTEWERQILSRPDERKQPEKQQPTQGMSPDEAIPDDETPQVWSDERVWRLTGL